jgi:hypothetical protein
MSAHHSDDDDLDTGLMHILKRATECPICLAPFRSPKTLPCGHTYCSVCLECQHILPSNPTKRKGAAKPKNVKCALCSVISPIPPKGFVVSFVVKGESSA